MPRSNDYNTLGQWAVFANFGGTLSMHAVGDESIEKQHDDDMLSARKLLDKRSRAVLLPVLKEALQDGTVVDTTVMLDGEQYSVRVVPVHMPDGSRAIGASAIYDLEGRILQGDLLIGAWQWLVGPDGTNYGDDASVWDDDLYRIHEYQPQAVNNARGPAGEWLNKLVPAAERDEVNEFVNKGLAACNNRALVLPMGAVVRPDSAHPSRKQLELIGTAMPHPRLRGVRLAYGFTREVPKRTASQPAGYSTMSAADLLVPYFEAATELCLVTIDLQINVMIQRSPGWRALGMDPAFDDNVVLLAPVRMHEEFRSYLQSSRSHAGDLPAFTTSLRTVSGDDVDVRIQSYRIDRENFVSRYLLLKVTAV